MRIEIILFFLFLFGACGLGFLAGYFWNSIFRDMERADLQQLEFGIVDRDIEIKELKNKLERLSL